MTHVGGGSRVSDVFLFLAESECGDWIAGARAMTWHFLFLSVVEYG